MPDEPQPSRRGRWRIVLQFGVSALAVWLIARQVDFRESGHLIAGARTGYVLGAIVLYVAGQMLSAYRWRLIGVSVGLADSYAHYVRYYFIGMFFMFFGPSTLGGDLVRSLYLAESAGSRSKAFNSVLFDRLNGLVVLVTIGAGAFLVFPEYRRLAPEFYVVFYVTVAFGTSLFLGWWLAPWLVRLLFAREHRIRQLVENDLGPFWSNRRMLIATAGVSFVFHFIQIAAQYLISRALGLAVPFAYICIFHPLVSSVAAIPISLSGLGVREKTYMYFLQQLGVSQSAGLAYGALWLVVIVVNSLLGGLVFVATGARLPRLRRAAA